jgi:outer membrane protein TolC
MKRPFYLFFSVLCCGAGGQVPPLQVTPELINRLSEEMRTNHPALKAASSRTEARRREAAAVRTWDDPILLLGVMGAEEEMRQDDGDILYGIEQKLPLWGKPKAAHEAVRAGITVAEADSEDQFQTRRRDLAQALLGVALADRLVELGEEDLLWLETMEATTDQRYQVGEAALAQLLRVQNERARRRDQLLTQRHQRAEAAATVNRLLGRPLEAPWPRLLLPPPAGPVVFTERLAALAENHEPRLKTLRAMVQQADAGIEVARRSARPDLSLGVEGRTYSGDGDFRQAMLTLRFNAPWVNRGKYRHNVAREAAGAETARQEAEDYTRRLREELFRLTVGIDAARREALLYRDDILPRSQRALESALASWLANRGLFWDVLEARRMLVEADVMHARAVAQQYELLSDLALCCGLGDLEALSMIGAQAETLTPTPTPTPTSTHPPPPSLAPDT